MFQAKANKSGQVEIAETPFIAAIVGLALIIHVPAFINHDVAFLTWTAEQVLGSAIFGRNIYEPSPPLSFLIYSPAALLAPLMGFDLAIKLWVVALASLSLVVLFQVAPKPLRFPVALALGLFFALAYPREFGQREQIALLLCAPYVAGVTASRRWAITTGVMAGIGFALKPYFLIPLALVFFSRRKMRVEEWSLVITGACYAAIIVLFFRPYLLEMLPIAVAAYWGISPGEHAVNRLLVFGLLLVPCLGLWAISRDGRATGYLMASVGFGIGAVVQSKFFHYHFLPAWGFMAMFLASYLINKSRVMQFGAIMILSALLVILYVIAFHWSRDSENRKHTIPDLLDAINRADSFTVFAVHPYPAFPTTIYTATPYLGLSSSHWFLPAVGKLVSGEAERSRAVVSELAIDQAVKELERRPGLVIVDTNWSRHTDVKREFNGLAWLEKNDRFRTLWNEYSFAETVGSFQLYTRCATGCPASDVSAPAAPQSGTGHRRER